jgi:hypothetical protein
VGKKSLEGRSNYSTMQIIRVDGHQFPEPRSNAPAACCDRSP